MCDFIVVSTNVDMTGAAQYNVYNIYNPYLYVSFQTCAIPTHARTMDNVWL